jgi:glycine/D-amino acid oxidase-like deaminating enzyme
MNLLHGYNRTERLVVAAGMIIGLLCALLVMGVWSRLDNRWRPVASPAGDTPTKIVALDRSLHVYVRTAKGDIYLCGGDPLTHSCAQVTPADLPANPVPPQWQSCGTREPHVPAAPGKVVDSILVGRCLEANTYSRLAILDDGSIWQWRRTLSWANWFALGVSIMLGLGFGAAAGILLVEVRRRLR